MSAEEKTPKTMHFDDIKPRLEGTRWHNLIPEEAVVQTVSFHFGQEIGSTSQDAGSVTFNGVKVKKPLGIILQGEAEVYESSWFDDDAVAYRPIRLMIVGDIFGDFSLVDTVLGLSSPSRPRETWKLSAGRKCMLLLNVVPNEVSLYKYPRRFELCNFCFSEEKTEIAFIDLQELDRDSPLFRYLLESAWERAQTYRLCVNSYNYQTLLSFRSNFLRKVSSQDNLEMARDAQIKIFGTAFADALFDAINRPVRREPVFSKMAHEWHGSGSIDLQHFGVKKDDLEILVSSNDYSRDFFFPLDLSNYFMNVYALAHLEELSEIGRVRELEQEKRKILKLFGRRTLPHGKNKEQELTKSLRFYREIVTSLLSSKGVLPDEYAYTVTCVDKPGPLSRRLLLRFTLSVKVPER